MTGQTTGIGVFMRFVWFGREGAMDSDFLPSQSEPRPGSDWFLAPQSADHGPLLGPFLDAAIGTERHSRPSYHYRQSVPALAELSLVTLFAGSRLIGSLRFWPVELRAGQHIESGSVLLLGPLAVDPRWQGKGVGRALMFAGLDKARKLGYRLCFLVGEPSYYARFGFEPASPLGYRMVVDVEPRKFQVLDLRGQGRFGGGVLLPVQGVSP